MAWITTVNEADATGELAAAYARITDERGLPFVPNIMRSLSLRPEAMDAVSRMGGLVTFGGSGLTREEEEMISTVVSSINHCHY